MKIRTLLTLSVAVALAWCAAPSFAKDNGFGDHSSGTGKAKSRTGKFDVSSEPAAAKPTTYRFKAAKKGSMGGAQVMTLLVQDPFGGHSETLFVQNNSANSKEYDPATAVADVVKDLKPGTLIDVTSEKQKGRSVVTAVTKTEIKPGEDLPDGFVFVESKEIDPPPNQGGIPKVTVTLSKYGREVTVGVPMVQRGSEWEPDPKVAYVVDRAQAGEVIEAKFNMQTRPPTITEVYQYKKPERGTFVKLKEVDYNETKAAGFEIKADDGTAITFTIPGKEQERNGQKLMIPDPQALAMVQRIKPDTPVEVRYHTAGRSWVMNGIQVLSDKKDKSANSGDDQMKMDKDKPDTDKPKKTAKATAKE